MFRVVILDIDVDGVLIIIVIVISVIIEQFIFGIFIQVLNLGLQSSVILFGKVERVVQGVVVVMFSYEGFVGNNWSKDFIKGVDFVFLSYYDVDQ